MSALALLCAGCFDLPATFTCALDAECALGERAGRCVQGFCANASDSCDSAWRWDEFADAPHAGQCVPPDGDLGAGDLGTGDLTLINDANDAAADAATDAAVNVGDGGHLGPGPLGALQSGFCCTARTECASRYCFGVDGGPPFCSGLCVDDSDCRRFSPDYRCDQATGYCMPNGNPYGCADPATYHYGDLGTGACCSSPDQCQGGVCSASGPAASQPTYCMQGCIVTPDCPIGFTCVDATRACVANANLLSPPQLYNCR